MQIKLLDLLCRIKKIEEEKEVLHKNQILEILKGLKNEHEAIIEERERISQAFTIHRFFKASELQDLIRIRDTLLEMEKIAENKIKDLNDELVRVEEKLVERHKERRLFERLKERETLKQREREAKRLYRELDELALLRGSFREEG